MVDKCTTIDDAKGLVKRFCDERDWDQFHNPKDLAIGISTEASELLDLFRFKSLEQCSQLLSDDKGRERIEDEIADVFYFVLRFAQMNGIDLSDALRRKVQKNSERYPVEKSKGFNLKYDEFE